MQYGNKDGELTMTAEFKQILDYCLSKMSLKELTYVKVWTGSVAFNLFLRNATFSTNHLLHKSTKLKIHTHIYLESILKEGIFWWAPPSWSLNSSLAAFGPTLEFQELEYIPPNIWYLRIYEFLWLQRFHDHSS